MRWITANWHELLAQPWASVALVIAAVACGGIVGIERERKQKTVGFRTLALVSLGSTVFTMIGASIDHRSPIAAQIVSGIGFLGAGVILRGPFGITGLTSAATIWAMAAVGMTVGTGYAGAGIALSFFMLGAMFVISRGEQRYVGACRYSYAVLTFRTGGGKTLIKIEEALEEFGIPRSNHELLPQTGTPAAGSPSSAALSSEAPRSPMPSHRQIRLRYCDAHRHHREFLAFLADMPEIEEIHRDGPDAPHSLQS